MMRLAVLAVLAILGVTLGGFTCTRKADSSFRVPPYVQNPAAHAMSILWLSSDARPGRLSYGKQGTSDKNVVVSTPELAEALASGNGTGAPYRHRIRLTELEPDTVYAYEVEQGSSRFQASFRTAPRLGSGPGQARPIRFLVTADIEADPGSASEHAPWPDPEGRTPDRRYLVDQARGFADNLAVMRARQPDFVAIAGDLVHAGGEQEDWDELWQYMAPLDGSRSLAAQVPIVAVPGNHEYYAGKGRGYGQPASEQAMARFRTYFEVPANPAVEPAHAGRYFRIDYGPIALIAIDVTNGSPQQSEQDTNFMLLGQGEPGGGHSPGFGPGTEQYRWLEAQLRNAQQTRALTMIMLHHVPYSVGPHGWPPGQGPGMDSQSGVPVRALMSLFLRHGVDAVLAGHDELWERSEISGTEVLPGGASRPHTIHVYDLGTGGDELRSPEPGLQNPYQKFLAHRDAPEQWQDGVLVAGGKHYGHLEVEVSPREDGTWQAVLTPVYVFPHVDRNGKYRGHERRTYDDVEVLTGWPQPSGECFPVPAY